MKKILEQLVLDPNSKPGYTLQNSGVLRYKGRIVVGDCPQLKDKILHALHESPLGGHSWI